MWWNSSVAVELRRSPVQRVRRPSLALWQPASAHRRGSPDTQITAPNILSARKTAGRDSKYTFRSLTLSWFRRLASTSTGIHLGLSGFLHLRSVRHSGSVCPIFPPRTIIHTKPWRHLTEPTTHLRDSHHSSSPVSSVYGKMSVHFGQRVHCYLSRRQEWSSGPLALFTLRF